MRFLSVKIAVSLKIAFSLFALVVVVPFSSILENHANKFNLKNPISDPISARPNVYINQSKKKSLFLEVP